MPLIVVSIGMGRPPTVLSNECDPSLVASLAAVSLASWLMIQCRNGRSSGVPSPARDELLVDDRLGRARNARAPSRAVGDPRRALERLERSASRLSSWVSTPSGLEFLPGVASKLRWYVYALRDPRDGTGLHIGKGKGDRAYEHARHAGADGGSLLDQKRGLIREIHVAGREVIVEIVRHQLADERAAYEVEAA